MASRMRRRVDGSVYKRGRIYWFKWYGVDGRRHYRSSESSERDVAAAMLRQELSRKDKGRAPSPDPRACLVNNLLDALAARYRIESRRSLERLLDACTHLLRLFDGVSAMRVTGADTLRYADLRLHEGAAAATVNRELAALRAAYRLG